MKCNVLRKRSLVFWEDCQMIAFGEKQGRLGSGSWDGMHIALNGFGQG